MPRLHPRSLAAFVALSVAACSGTSVDETETPAGQEAAAAGDSIQELAIETVSDEALRPYFSKQIDIFGVPIVGTAAIADRKVVHAAHVMAQYLDNDEDGEVDDPNVLQAMIEGSALLVMFADFEELEQSGIFDDDRLRDAYASQDLEGHETVTPEDRVEGDAGDRFDAAIEEIWHLVSSAGYATAYPNAFGPEPGSRLADAMDLARGGRFFEIPESYPEGA